MQSSSNNGQAEGREAQIRAHSTARLGTLDVLLALASFDGPRGIDPAVLTIARKAKRSESATQRALARLIAAGELSVTMRTGGRGRTSQYTILIECPPECREHPIKGGVSSHSQGLPSEETPPNQEITKEKTFGLPQPKEELRSSGSPPPGGDTDPGGQMKAKDDFGGGEDYGTGGKLPGRVVTSGVKPAVDGRVKRLRQEFDRLFSEHPPLYTSVGKAYGIIRWMLSQHYSEKYIVKAFELFLAEIGNYPTGEGHACFDTFARHKTRYLEAAATHFIGARADSMSMSERAAMITQRQKG